MFEGAAALNLDAKGRLAIPARHRDALIAAGNGELVLTAHPHKCLLLYPAPAWQPIRDQILKASSLDPRAAAIKRVMVRLPLAEAESVYSKFLSLITDCLTP